MVSFIWLGDGQHFGLGLDAGMLPARPRGLAALCLRFSRWLGRSTSALLFLPLMASAEVITFETKPEQARQALVDMASQEPVRICANAAVGGSTGGVSGLGGPGGIADPCASPAALLSARQPLQNDQACLHRH
jgi:hypothetical protein